MNETRDIDYLNSPDEWVTWPVCPVKRYTPRGGLEIALVMTTGEGLKMLPGANLFDPPESWKKITPLDVTALDVVRQGWRVD